MITRKDLEVKNKPVQSPVVKKTVQPLYINLYDKNDDCENFVNINSIVGFFTKTEPMGYGHIKRYMVSLSNGDSICTNQRVYTKIKNLLSTLEYEPKPLT